MNLMRAILLALCGGNLLLDASLVLVVGGIVFIVTRPTVRQWWSDCVRDWEAFRWGHFDG